MAVAGVPVKRDGHAVVMARFARDCLSCMNDLTKHLEVSLGPDTTDLSIRIGLHSGPVTGGVLRGDKSRFQLFGDTMNTTARIESNGLKNRIHISGDTAQLLIDAGKGHWVKEREDKITAKGKGEMQTYWLEMKVSSGPSTYSGSSEGSGDEFDESGRSPRDASGSLVGKETIIDCSKLGSVLDDKSRRLVEWNTEVLARILRQIVARRTVSSTHETETPAITALKPMGSIVIDEVKEIIHLPEFNAKVLEKQQNPESVTLDPEVISQLRSLVTSLATMYRDNPFHNWEHASHVALSVVK